MSLEDELLDEAASYWWFAAQFGWTPDQVDELPAWLAARLPTVAAVNDEIQADEAKRAQSSAGGGR